MGGRSSCGAFGPKLTFLLLQFSCYSDARSLLYFSACLARETGWRLLFRTRLSFLRRLSRVQGRHSCLSVRTWSESFGWPLGIQGGSLLFDGRWSSRGLERFNNG